MANQMESDERVPCESDATQMEITFARIGLLQAFHQWQEKIVFYN